MSRGKKWTKAEDEVLAQGIEEKTSYEDIAQALGRTEKAVQMRAFNKRRASKRYQRNNMNGTSAPKPKAKAMSKPAPKAPEPEGRYTLVPVVESTAVNASLNRLFIVCVASMVFSVSTLVLLSAALLTA
tara:strand:+ start:221 stop:607 length:387 start_codon:yes stop_codon:yes gene_type:complete